jgi:alpha-tubulin suppressor-like RCC1 family protein
LCAFGAPHDLYCWGSNTGGALGTPLLFDDVIRAPVQIRIGERRFVSFLMSVSHTCGLSEDGLVLCIGPSFDAELGYAGLYDATLHPADNWARLPNGGAVDLGDFDGEPGIDPAVALLVERSMTCARMRDRSLRCWGTNSYGRLGYGFASDSAPAPLVNLGSIGNDETPAQAYARIGRPHLVLW